MQHVFRETLESTEVKSNAEAGEDTHDIDLKSMAGLDGLLICSATSRDLGIPDGYELDPNEPVIMERVFRCTIREKSSEDS